jgi:hypothetical protein
MSADPTNELSKYLNVPKKGTEFARIEYMLQLSLGTSTAVITNIWNITRPQLNMEFERNVEKRKLLVIYSFVDTASFDKGTTVESVINSGFDVGQGGMNFSTGLFKLTKSGASSYRVLLCKVAVGRSLVYPVSEETEEQAKQKMTKENFDSVYLKHDDDESASIYRYAYTIYEKELIHPEYLIDFTFDESRESNLREPNCDDPGCSNVATHYCKNDKANLCTSCNEKYHEGIGSLMKKHEVVSIKERPRQFGKCDTHKDQDYQFFCTKCKTVLCIYCKINGSHSQGEYGNHPLITIGEAFQEAVKHSKEADPNMEKHKASLKNMLKTVDDRISMVTENAKNTENELYSILEKALESLHSHTQAKLNVLLADQLELRRRYEEIQWAESFLKYQYEVLEPQNYLRSWFR